VCYFLTYLYFHFFTLVDGLYKEISLKSFYLSSFISKNQKPDFKIFDFLDRKSGLPFKIKIKQAIEKTQIKKSEVKK
jgi:hypothetical protein